MENKYTRQDLTAMQAWSLERKIQVTQLRIMEFVEHFDGQAYISFSGGKDSTVLLDLARRAYPDIEAVFADTGLEHPEIRQFVKTKDNVTQIKPKMNFVDVLEKYGYPVISKAVSKNIKEYKKNPNGENSKKLLGTHTNKDGGKSIYCCDKYKYLIDAPFKISDMCCEEMKKKPFKSYEKQSGKNPINGMIADESQSRSAAWIKNGCNAFDSKRPKSMPMAFWTGCGILKFPTRSTNPAPCNSNSPPKFSKPPAPTS